jgi:hypothetical protein
LEDEVGSPNTFKWLIVHVCALAGLLVSGADASAQPARVNAWDSSAMTGLFLGHPGPLAATESGFDDWYPAAALAMSAGRYLTPHLKAEAEFTISSEGARYVQEFVQVPGAGLYPIGSEQMVRTNGVSATLAWQFFDNQWVHPFVFGGVALDFDRTRVQTWAQSYYRGDPRVPGNELRIAEERTVDLGTSRRVRGVIGTGAKFYVTERTFFRTDARAAIDGESRGHLSFRLGFGMDF